MRFTSHRDFARAFERAVRRAEVPIAYSQGFTPHPKISYASAAPTGVASEAEYLELGLQAPADPADVARALDAVLPPGLDILDAVTAGTGPLADRIDVSRWLIELPGVEEPTAEAAVAAFLAADEVPVERLTKQGRRRFDARAAVVSATLARPNRDSSGPCAILEVVIRHATPTVRPADVLRGLDVVSGLEPPIPPRTTRLAQGVLTDAGDIADPLGPDKQSGADEQTVEETSA